MKTIGIDTRQRHLRKVHLAAPAGAAEDGVGARTRQVVTAFLDALARGDGKALRATLTRGCFRFVGTLDHFDDADAFVADIEHYALILRGVERHRMLVEGHEACVTLTYLTSLDNLARTRAAAWLRTDDDDRICHIESFLDPRAYVDMFGPSPGR